MSMSVSAVVKPWFKNGVKFSCVQCGKCCQGLRTNVFVNASEMKELAAAKNMDLQSFVRKYTEDREIGTAGGELVLHTTIKNVDGACSLLSSDRKTCTVHDVKPAQCRSYPFGWPQVVIGEAEWKAEAQKCPGIDSKLSERVTKDAIVKSLLVGMVHNRGVGEDWTYDEAVALLTEADATEGGALLSNFEEEFFSNNSSKLVHQSDKIRVVDSTTPAPDGSGAQETFRRLEFTASSATTQSEVPLDPWGNPDHSRLVLEFHKVMASLVRSRVGAVPGPRRMVMLGGGAGALSSHLTSDTELATSLHVDVVEPDAEVSMAAVEYFGAKYNQPGGNTHLYECTGEHFLGSQYVDKGSVDVLVVDAADSLPLSFFTGRKGDDLREPIAPPPSLLQDPAALVNCLKDDGVTFINFLGDEGLLDAMHGIITSGLQADGIAVAEPVVLAPSYMPNRMLLLAKDSTELKRIVQELQAEDNNVRAYTLERAGVTGTAAREVPF